MAKRSATDAARREVREEAGLTGTVINAKPVGYYLYKKRLAPEILVTCRVAVFLLRVPPRVYCVARTGTAGSRMVLAGGRRDPCGGERARSDLAGVDTEFPVFAAANPQAKG